jgi:hypothetical protein
MSRSSVRKTRPDADNYARTASRGEVTIHGVLPTASDLWSQVPRTGRWSRVAQCAPVRFAIGLLFLVPGATLETLGSLVAVPLIMAAVRRGQWVRFAGQRRRFRALRGLA